MVYRFIFVILLASTSLSSSAQQTFKEKQKAYSRVREAYETKYDGLKAALLEVEIDITSLELYIIGYKKNKDLEIWARNKGSTAFKLFKTYKFCALSGELGPKRMQGDMQVPEGFYHIYIYNPYSNFHLSMGINYPNRSDRILGVHGNLGGDIYIHGSCVTIGCIPITNTYIKELYILCMEAKNNGQERIPVTLYPAKMEEGMLDRLIDKNDPDYSTKLLWQELQTAYDLFEARKTFPKITFNSDGSHVIK
jgi:murein L,D-transpeptidase YafK